MKLVYPPNGHETFESATFLIGSVPPGQQVCVNGQEIFVTARGSFAAALPLQPGENRIRLDALRSPDDVADRVEVMIYRHPPKVPLSRDTLAVDETTMRPAQATVQAPGHWLQIGCLATPGVQASVTIPGLLKSPVVLKAHEGTGSVDNREGLFGELHQTQPILPASGYYEGSILIPEDAPELDGASIHLQLHHPNGDSWMRTFPGTLSVWKQPKNAVVSSAWPAILRTGPSFSAARLTPQLSGTCLVIDGKVGHWSRVRLARDEAAWIHEDDITLPAEPAESWIPRLPLRLVKTRAVSASETQVLLPLRAKIPLLIQSKPDTLRVSLYGAESHCDVMRVDPADRVVSALSWEQIGESRLDLKIQSHGLAGYDALYTEEGLVVTLKTLAKPYKDMVIMVDPGHGGEEMGTTGPDGTAEKSVNLAVARLLLAALHRGGFEKAFLGREGDDTVSLEARMALARERRADIVVSLHHNALPDGRDPWGHCGVSSYYYHPFAQPFARCLQDGLVRGLGAPDYGLLYDSLAMTRIHSAMAVLIELGFFTHPEEFDRLMDAGFQQNAAECLARAIKQFVVSRS